MSKDTIRVFLGKIFGITNCRKQVQKGKKIPGHLISNYDLPASSALLLLSLDAELASPATAADIFCSLAFVSFSSSLSPRLNGSCSPTGDGSTVVNGCHLLGLPPVDGASLAGSDVPQALLPISVGGPSWKDTFRLSGEEDEVLCKSGLARGLGGRGGGAMAKKVSHRIMRQTKEDNYK